MKTLRLTCAGAALSMVASSYAAFSINLIPNTTLSSNAAALAAFQRAAHRWETKFTDNITVNINCGLAALGNGIIGQASSFLLAGNYSAIRNAMVADAADETSNGIVASLPTAAQFTAFLKPGNTLANSITVTKANAKALGFTGLDTSFGLSDATINFSTAFSFDFDDSDGITAGTMSFETVAAHEIGHALGFTSGVDGVDTSSNVTGNLTTLDLFRFRSSNLPTLGNFATTTRSFMAGDAASFSDGVNSWAFSTGRTLGDGNQASHWKADEITGTTIGIMDPTLDFGQTMSISNADLRAFDLIGYDLAPVPEPATMLVLGAALPLLAKRRRAKKS